MGYLIQEYHLKLACPEGILTWQKILEIMNVKINCPCFCSAQRQKKTKLQSVFAVCVTKFVAGGQGMEDKDKIRKLLLASN